MVAAQKKLLSFLYVGWSCRHHQVQAILVWGSNQQTLLCHHKHHLVDTGGTQTHNPRLQKSKPHPLGHLVLPRVKEVFSTFAKVVNVFKVLK